MRKNKQTADNTDFWDAHKEAELDSWLQATPQQRLIWLEDAIRLAAAAGALPAPPPTGAGRGGGSDSENNQWGI